VRSEKTHRLTDKIHFSAPFIYKNINIYRKNIFQDNSPSTCSNGLNHTLHEDGQLYPDILSGADRRSS